MSSLADLMRLFAEGAMAGAPRVFSATFRAYSVAVLGRPELEDGDKVVLPQSALVALTQMEVQYPMMFRLSGGTGGAGGAPRATHCGVIEFIAEEGRAYLPHWMMEGLRLEEGHFVEARNVVLPKGSFVKFRPHSTDFIRLSNPKAVLERHLPKFSCLTQGDTIALAYQGRKYYIDVVEVKPAVRARAHTTPQLRQ
jgi:ubiquitin fusion degradation protein 1